MQAILSLPKLRLLSMAQCNNLGGWGFTRALGDSLPLEVLILAGCQAFQPANFCYVTMMPFLTVLDVQNTAADHRLIEHLSELFDLRVLNLSRTQINDQAIRNLANFFGRPAGSCSLFLAGTAITPAAVYDLQRMALRELDITGTSIRALEALRPIEEGSDEKGSPL